MIRITVYLFFNLFILYLSCQLFNRMDMWYKKMDWRVWQLRDEYRQKRLQSLQNEEAIDRTRLHVLQSAPATRSVCLQGLQCGCAACMATL